MTHYNLIKIANRFLREAYGDVQKAKELMKPHQPAGKALSTIIGNPVTVARQRMRALQDTGVKPNVAGRYAKYDPAADSHYGEIAGRLGESHPITKEYARKAARHKAGQVLADKPYEKLQHADYLDNLQGMLDFRRMGKEIKIR